MKKSTLLSLLTAGAVIATSAGTFAAWDTTTATSTGTLTIDKPVTVTVSALNLERDGGLGQSTPVYIGEVNVKAEDLPASVTADKYEITYEAKAYLATDETNKAPVEGITVTPNETTSVGLNQEHTVEVTVAVTDEAAAKTLAQNSTQLKVDVTAKLEAKPAQGA